MIIFLRLFRHSSSLDCPVRNVFFEWLTHSVTRILLQQLLLLSLYLPVGLCVQRGFPEQSNYTLPRHYNMVVAVEQWRKPDILNLSKQAAEREGKKEEGGRRKMEEGRRRKRETRQWGAKREMGGNGWGSAEEERRAAKKMGRARISEERRTGLAKKTGGRTMEGGKRWGKKRQWGTC